MNTFWTNKFRNWTHIFGINLNYDKKVGQTV